MYPCRKLTSKLFTSRLNWIATGVWTLSMGRLSWSSNLNPLHYSALCKKKRQSIHRGSDTPESWSSAFCKLLWKSSSGHFTWFLASIIYCRGIGSISSRFFHFVSPCLKKSHRFVLPSLNLILNWPLITLPLTCQMLGKIVNNHNQEGSWVIKFYHVDWSRWERVSTEFNKCRDHKKRKSIEASLKVGSLPINIF